MSTVPPMVTRIGVPSLDDWFGFGAEEAAAEAESPGDEELAGVALCEAVPSESLLQAVTTNTKVMGRKSAKPRRTRRGRPGAEELVLVMTSTLAANFPQVGSPVSTPQWGARRHDAAGKSAVRAPCE
ncbi:hypothetical protein OG250_41945 [Streptomyces sp. NBC_00487]|uniref:hypothetical protein n=1 Tax=unclassified Streptomyces TaxID=2593676 RepID=UPI002E185F95|nr:MULTISPECIES: hypothetical protein [unclassified Streptomyces]